MISLIEIEKGENMEILEEKKLVINVTRSFIEGKQDPCCGGRA